MLNLKFIINNPWAKEDNFRSILTFFQTLTKNKTFELDFYYDPKHVLGINLSTNWRGYSHAGPKLELDVLGYTTAIQVYDTRHWDYENNQWIEYTGDDC